MVVEVVMRRSETLKRRLFDKSARSFAELVNLYAPNRGPLLLNVVLIVMAFRGEGLSYQLTACWRTRLGRNA